MEYANEYFRGVQILEEGDRNGRLIHIDIALQSALKVEAHKTIMTRIKQTLEQRGIDAGGLFSYCEKSYGLQYAHLSCDLSLSFSYDNAKSLKSTEKRI